MNLKRAFLIALAACILPGAALAQTGVEVRFIVTKNFMDGNTAPVDVKLTCNDGEISQDGMATITDDGIGHTFIVTGLTALAEVHCEVTEGDMTGYKTSYWGWSTNDKGLDTCKFYYPSRDAVEDIGLPLDVIPNGIDAVFMGRLNRCMITNTPLPATIEVTKEWDVTNTGGNGVDYYAEINVWADAKIVGGWACDRSTNPNGCKKLTFVGDTPSKQSVTVDTAYDGVKVNFMEVGVDSYVATENDCGGYVTVTPGETGESCGFTNTVFFEGIPTLSQYGMAIMALLMLGVGFVGFRRFI